MKFGSFIKKRYSSDTMILCEFLNCDIVFSAYKSVFLDHIPKKLLFILDCTVVDYYKINELNVIKVVLL